MIQENHLKVSLVIPVKNEDHSLAELIESIENQSYQPDEVIFVDGGSTDRTIEIIECLSSKNPKFKFIKLSSSSPGKGRNTGIENTRNEWIALTDAGIEIEKDWLKNLVKELEDNPQADVIYGNYSPIIKCFFDQCAAICYVPRLTKNSIRGKSVATILLKKKVWEEVNGFPDLRAAEDLIFLEAVNKKEFKTASAPNAMVFWQLRPDLSSTFDKFIVYSKHNVLAGRAWDWHYGVARQYLIALFFIILAFVHSWWWLIIVFLWLVARVAKRILSHRFEYGLKPLLNPVYFLGITFTILIVDLATFIGWGQAVLQKESREFVSILS